MDWIAHESRMLALFAAVVPGLTPRVPGAGAERAAARLEAHKAMWAETPKVAGLWWELPDGTRITPTRQAVRAYQRAQARLEASEVRKQARAASRQERQKGKIKRRWAASHQGDAQAILARPWADPSTGNELPEGWERTGRFVQAQTTEMLPASGLRTNVPVENHGMMRVIASGPTEEVLG